MAMTKEAKAARGKLSRHGYRVYKAPGPEGDGGPDSFAIHWIVNDDEDNWQEQFVGIFTSPETAVEFLEATNWPRTNGELRGAGRGRARRAGRQGP